ncbi:MAG: hypothetical protein OXI10_14160 [Gammaproteobacteria bacterium]|nr:hypothetical protein [Gammaproteobacteria bacterium]
MTRPRLCRALPDGCLAWIEWLVDGNKPVIPARDITSGWPGT